MWYGELDPECKAIEQEYAKAFKDTSGPFVSDEAKERLAELEVKYTRCKEKHLVGTLRDAMRLAGFGISGNGSLRQLAAQIDGGPNRLRQIMLRVLEHNSLDRIKHFVVLMLENRSFDHMLGLLASHGVDPNTGVERHPLQGIDSLKGELCVLEGLTKNHSSAHENMDVDGTSHRPGGPAHFSLTVDPEHGHKSTKRQLIGEVTLQEQNEEVVFVGTRDEDIFDNSLAKDIDIKNKGFAYHYPTENAAWRKERRLKAEAAMECFLPEQLPVMSQLAQEFAICDAWFSSMPGPTCPNRFFVHAATSDGLIDDVGAILNSFIDGYSFDNGTLFDKLDDLGKSWKVFAVDGIINQANLLEGVDFPFDILEFESRADLAKLFEEERPFYTFIEPEYVKFDPDVAEVNVELDVDLDGLDVDVDGDIEIGLTPSGYVGGSSMHPCGDVRDGERLIKHVYEALRNSTLWEKSALIILFDEHGGFFDHVRPPAAVSPDGKSKEDDTGLKFDFKRLGVRVPALVISPWVNKGTIDKVKHDHTSVIKTISQRTNGFSLTKRDRKAPGLSHVFRAFKPRMTSEEAPKILKPQVSKSDGEWARIRGADASKVTAPRTAAPSITGGLHETRPIPLQRLPDVTPLTQLPATDSWVPALVAAYKKTHQRKGLAGAPSAGIPQVASPVPGIPKKRVDTLGDAKALYDETRKRLEQMHGSKVRPKQRIRRRPKFGIKKP